MDNNSKSSVTRASNAGRNAETTREIPDLLSRIGDRRQGEITQKNLHKLIDVSKNLSTIELTLTVIVVVVVILRVAVADLIGQFDSLLSNGDARRLFDVSIAVGFLGIILAAVQIPKNFADAIVYSNSDAMRIFMVTGASPNLVARCFANVVLSSMAKAAWKGLVVVAVLYVSISEVAQIWVPVTRTYFLREVAETFVGIGVFIFSMHFILKRKVMNFYENFGN